MRVLVTGASGGLGSCIADEFEKIGAVVGRHSHTQKGEFQADLTNMGEIKYLVGRFINRFGGIDVLVNCAGGAFDYLPFSELPLDSFNKTFALNVGAPFYLMSAIFEHMKENGGGRIINISSVNVKYGGSAKSMHYVASKAALESLTLGFAREGAKHNILVNAIRAGYIDTPMRKNIKGYTEEDMKKRVGLIPLGHMGKPIDIARMALFLACDSGEYITKEIFTVAGGD